MIWKTIGRIRLKILKWLTYIICYCCRVIIIAIFYTPHKWQQQQIIYKLMFVMFIIITLLYSISVYLINEHRSLDDLNPRNLLLSIKYYFYTTEQVIQAWPVSSIILQCIKMLKEWLGTLHMATESLTRSCYTTTTRNSQKYWAAFRMTISELTKAS